jgi:hypothetical protein
MQSREISEPSKFTVITESQPFSNPLAHKCLQLKGCLKKQSRGFLPGSTVGLRSVTPGRTLTTQAKGKKAKIWSFSRAKSKLIGI